MPILLMNLLIGLAVGDIESVQSNARLKRLAMQVELHINMESKMPLCIHRIAQITEFKQFPNKCQRKLENFFSMMSLKSTDSDLKNPQSGMGSYLYEEMYKQKVRMREMTTTLDKNNQLLRQIMQKMEIHTEDEAWDEGAGLSDDSNDELKSSNKQYNSKSFKEKMYLKTAIVSFWKKGFSQL
ncbi:unnamed protein product [Lymnaea stagnalis]|uniref:Ion transport domain-containing protein n=1 Tax=Lymnaea stagnalis TaxID=6523 RepID=A0AAV2HNG9_LYMST